MPIAGDICTHRAAHFAAEAVESNRPFYLPGAQSPNGSGAGRSGAAIVKVSHSPAKKSSTRAGTGSGHAVLILSYSPAVVYASLPVVVVTLLSPFFFFFFCRYSTEW